MTRLLISVRSAEEALAAVAGGADIIDLKEPVNGPLGRASDCVLCEVLQAVNGRRPVSVAFGELIDELPPPSVSPDSSGFTVAKVGLAGCAALSDWKSRLGRLHEQMTPASLVVVAYADFRRAESPRPQEVLDVALEMQSPAFLLDTWGKDGSTLLDWLPVDQLAEMQHVCFSVNLPIALAGSLAIREIQHVLPLRPDIIAVRGAACCGGLRGATIDEQAVRRLASLLRASGETSQIDHVYIRNERR